MSKRETTERVGFEPTVPFEGYASLAGTCLRPLSHLSIEKKVRQFIKSRFSQQGSSRILKIYRSFPLRAFQWLVWIEPSGFWTTMQWTGR